MVVAIIMFVVALGFVVYGAFNYVSKKKEYDDLLASCTETVNGDVISCDSHVVTTRQRVSKHHTKTVSTTYYLTKVSFKVDGKEYICTYDSKSEFPVGSMTQLQYDPNDPDRCFVGSNPVDNYSSYMRPMIVGAVLAISGVVTLFARKRT